MSDKYQKLAEAILHLAGVTVNGRNPWDIQVQDRRFFRRAIAEGELGVGESYMDGWWDARQLDDFINRVLRVQLDEEIRHAWSILLRLALAKAVNLQSRRRAFIIGERHYNLGNELFLQMLDKRMNYSCAYWDGATTLDEAQENKLDLVCRKLRLQPGTVSQQQVELGRKLCEGLPVELRLMDYRDVDDAFDRIVSVGMIEHVGYKNYRAYFEVAHRCLKDDGLFLLHTIGGNRSASSLNAWTNRYIFPNGMLPSIAQLGKAIEGLFVMEDWHSFGQYYDKTLMAWYQNVTSHWETLRDRYDDRFYRMWKFYLLSSAGAFRARHNQLWQIVLSKHGIVGGYGPVR
jgi:cyclopropane-fatty-acyl-phospholipid synthase